MKREIRYASYVAITIVCIIAVFIGVYSQFFKRKADKDEDNTLGDGNATNVISYVQVKENFKDLFTNELIDNDYDDSNIQKENNSMPIVYSGIELDEESDGKYDINVTLPVINIKGVSYNNTTEDIFVNKLNDIIKNSDLFTICDFNYISYINNDILSVAIMASIKEGDSAQRIIIQTYNYNLQTGEDVSFSDVLNSMNLDSKNVESRIKTIVRKVAEDSKSMQDTGYTVYERDTDSAIYEVKNIDSFILGPEDKLYVIFAYGNNAFTSEMDIIEF